MPFNFEFTYKKNGKHIFVPNEECIRRGNRLIHSVSSKVRFPSYFFHYESGGHVSALHAHLKNTFFFRVDLQNFFYSISRNRVASALRDLEIRGARQKAEWPCVKNPFPGPSHSLPIGFVQSPILASLVLLLSPIATVIEISVSEGVFTSIYFDDLVGSSNDIVTLDNAYKNILAACIQSNFVANETKLVPPTSSLTAFNCNLTHGIATVSEERIIKFFETPRSQASITAFTDYRVRVQRENFR